MKMATPDDPEEDFVNDPALRMYWALNRVLIDSGVPVQQQVLMLFQVRAAFDAITDDDMRAHYRMYKKPDVRAGTQKIVTDAINTLQHRPGSRQKGRRRE